MSLSLVNEIWKLLKPSIEAGDTDGAADTLVNYLIEEDHSPAEIKTVFRGDKDIKNALEFFMESPDDGLYHRSDDDYNDLYEDYYNDDEEDDRY